jgi:hypothetical protein
MAGRTRVMTVRLKQGGILLLAPSNILPWPRVLPRRSRALMIPALQRAIGDASAMQRLRRNYNQLLNTTVARGSRSMSDQELVGEYMYAARRGWLTVIFGHIESTASDKPPGTVVGNLFEGHAAIDSLKRRIAVASVDPRADVPKQDVRIPHRFEERMTWVVSRAPRYMTTDEEMRFREFFTTDGLKTTIAILILWSMSHVSGVGFIVDAALFASAIWQLGSRALQAFEHLKKFFDLTRNPGSWRDMDEASHLFASAMTVFGLPLMRQLMRRIGSDTGTQGQMTDYEAEPARIGTPTRRKSDTRVVQPAKTSGGGSAAAATPGKSAEASAQNPTAAGSVAQEAAAALAAVVAERRRLAREFYRAQGMLEAEIEARLARIDFTKPVEVVTLKAGEIIDRLDLPGDGVLDQVEALAKAELKHRVEKEVQALRFTATQAVEAAGQALVDRGAPRHAVDDLTALAPL